MEFTITIQNIIGQETLTEKQVLSELRELTQGLPDEETSMRLGVFMLGIAMKFNRTLEVDGCDYKFKL